MLQVALAPCSPFSVSAGLMRETATLARSLGVRLHTHLAENDDDVAYSRERFGRTPAEYADALGWTGADVWHAHCVKLDAPGIARFAATGTGVAHCPCSNMRLGSGIAPLRAMLDAGVRVGLGVDGSASNDGADMLGEARAGDAAAARRPRTRRAVGARGAGAGDARRRRGPRPHRHRRAGARDGRRPRRRSTSAGSAYAGAAEHDPLAALVFCAPQPAALTIVNGRIVVRDGRIVTIDERAVLARHRTFARALGAPDGPPGELR